jgi:PAS domain S-box-containing protein
MVGNTVDELERYRWLVEEASDGIFITDNVGKFTFANPAACAMLGYTLEELYRLHIPDLHSPGEPPPRLGELREGRPVVSERNLRRKDGSLFPAELSSKMMHDGTLQSIVRDISLRRQLDNERREAESRYKQIFQTNPAIKMLIDPESADIVDVNEAACEFYGYSQAEFLKLKITDINQLSDPEIKAELNAASRESRLYFRFPHRLRSGEIRTMEIYTGPVILQGKKLLFSILHDISDRVAAERDLRLREEYFRSLINSAPDIITVVSADLRIRYQSPAIERVLGYSAEELIGTELIPLLHEADRAKASQGIQDHLNNTADPLPVEIRCRHKSGSWRTLEVWGNNLLGDPAVEGLVFNSRDITERKKSERDLLERTEELERLNRIMVDRELRMVELKKEIARLSKR